MAAKRTSSSSKPSLKCIWLLDVAVLSSIWMIAGRADGLAIALSALSVAAVILSVRRVLDVQCYLRDRRRKAGVKQPVPAPSTPAAPASRWQQERKQRADWLRQD